MSFANYSQLPASMKDDELNDLVIDAKDFAFSFGLLLRTRHNTEPVHEVAHAPFTLFPSPVSRQCFLDALSVQTDFNLLIHRIANDSDFLFQCLERVIETDDFTRRLWNICSTVRKQNHGCLIQPVTLAINRSDYMIGSVENDGECMPTSTTAHTRNIDTLDRQNNTGNRSGNGDSGRCPAARPADCNGPQTCSAVTDRFTSRSTSDVSLKQIELNTTSFGGAGLATIVNKLHRFLLGQNPSKGNPCGVPENRAVVGLADAMCHAWRLYGDPSSVILFLVHEVEANAYDLCWHGFAIREIDSSVRVIRRTLNDIKLRAHVTTDKRLIIDDMEVAVVYMRSCYKPSDYKTDDDWNARLMMECSKAIVCPTAAYQLAGTKKVQQMLVKPGAVERFIDDEAAVRRIRSTFVEQFSLDLNEEGERNAQWAIGKPHMFVMKPQRERGHNVFGEAIRTELLRLKNSSDRSSYILTKRINPVIVRNLTVAWRQNIELRELVSEIGIYGTLIADGDNVLANKQDGYLMRTKRVGADEEGSVNGSVFLDSPYLVDC